MDVVAAFGLLLFRNVFQRAEPAKDSTFGMDSCEVLLEPLGSLGWLLKHRCFGFWCWGARQCRLSLLFKQSRVAAKLNGTLAGFFGRGVRDGFG